MTIFKPDAPGFAKSKFAAGWATIAPFRQRLKHLAFRTLCSYIFVATRGRAIRWIWDAKKDRLNRRAHGLSFGTALLVFDDPLAVSRLDDADAEERWQTVGSIGGVSFLWSTHGPSLPKAVR
jgi:uncharacterized DUF497 family protein